MQARKQLCTRWAWTAELPLLPRRPNLLQDVLMTLATEKGHCNCAGQAAALYEMGLDGEASFAAAEADGPPAQEASSAAAALRPAGRSVLATRLLLSYNPQVCVKEALLLSGVFMFDGRAGSTKTCRFLVDHPIMPAFLACTSHVSMLGQASLADSYLTAECEHLT